MTSRISVCALERAIEHHRRDSQEAVREFVFEVIRQVDLEMRQQPAHVVYEQIIARRGQRLPGIDVEDAVVRDAAVRIAAGVPVAF